MQDVLDEVLVHIVKDPALRLRELNSGRSKSTRRAQQNPSDYKKAGRMLISSTDTNTQLHRK